MIIRDRIKELRRVPARELKPNERNWRVHPASQREALRGVLNEVGYADALLARELPDGSLELIDGHLRAETTPDQLVPVLVLDVSADEATKILLTHDPLAALAEKDSTNWQALLDSVSFNDPAVQRLFESLPHSNTSASEEPASPAWQSSWQVVVTCAGEENQRELFERLTGEGYACRLLML